MELLPCIIFVKSSADPRLLGALRKTLSPAGEVGWNVVIGMKEWMKLMHLSVLHSVSNRAHGKRSRNSASSAARYAFNSVFCLEQETV